MYNNNKKRGHRERALLTLPGLRMGGHSSAGSTIIYYYTHICLFLKYQYCILFKTCIDFDLTVHNNDGVSESPKTPVRMRAKRIKTTVMTLH